MAGLGKGWGAGNAYTRVSQTYWVWSEPWATIRPFASDLCSEGQSSLLLCATGFIKSPKDHFVTKLHVGFSRCTMEFRTWGQRSLVSTASQPPGQEISL